MLKILPLLFVLCLSGCTAGMSQVETPAPKEDPEKDPKEEPVDPEPTLDEICRTTVDVDRAPMRRLSRTEYQNSVRVLFGIEFDALGKLSADEKVSAFDANVVSSVDELMAEEYLSAAQEIAEEAIKTPQALMGCSFEQIDDACRDNFITSFGKRIWRRPLSQDEKDRFTTLYESLKNEYDPQAGVVGIIMAALQSPHFLYRLELGGDVGPNETLIKNDAYQTASRLAFFLTQATPDQTLLAAADQNKLETREQIEAQSRRLLASPEARDVVRSFHSQWLGVESIKNVVKAKYIYPQFTPELLASMEQETASFIDHVFWEEGASLETLLTAPYSYVNKDLANLYGVTAPSGDGFEWTMLDNTQRAGILTHPSMLARMSHTRYTSPTLRGEWVRKYLMCETLTPPPDEFDTTPPEFDRTQNTRQRYEQILFNSKCGGCHALTDPIGFGFEHYDALGAWRAKDDGHDIDATGEVLFSKGLEGKFNGAVEMAQKLARSEQVQSCVTKQWFRFALGRYESEFDACSLHQAKQHFAKSNHDIRELLVALTTTDAFRYRRKAGE